MKISVDLLIILFIIVVALNLIFYNRYKIKLKARLQGEMLKEQLQTSIAIIAVEELERKRIADDLNDEIGQVFSAVKMNLSGAMHRVNFPGAEDQCILEKIIALIDDGCKEIRMMSHRVNPTLLLELGLVSATRDFIGKIDERGLKITLETFGLQRPLEASTEIVLYRIIQEAVDNVIKHADATQLDIQMHKDESSITVTIEDNGVGFNITKPAKLQGIGLKSMQARAEFLNGKVDYDTAPGRGTLVAIYIPSIV